MSYLKKLKPGSGHHIAFINWNNNTNEMNDDVPNTPLIISAAHKRRQK